MTNSKKVHVGLVFKDFAMWLHRSCVGLDVAGHATAKVLRKQGVDVSVFAVRHNVDIVEAIDRYNETHSERLTHLVISAPWLSIRDITALVQNFSDIQFVVLSHSNVGFLQADPDGVFLLRQYASLTKQFSNFHVGGNSEKFTRWFSRAYNQDVVLLPNLYPLDSVKSIRPVLGRVVKIGAFGAIRPYKNFMTAAGAALLIQRKLAVPVEFHMSGGGENDVYNVISAIRQILANTGVRLVIHDWAYWDSFIQLISGMNLLIQASYTESFNMVTADGISQNVPSVVSPAIYWAPEDWKAEPDDANDIADVGLRLLKVNSASDGFDALTRHNQASLKLWFDFLQITNPWHRRIAGWFKS